MKILIKTIDITAYFLLTAATLIMVVSIFLQVFFRYVIGAPLFWSEEISRYAFIWVVFIGAALATKRGSHIGVDYFVSRLSERSQQIIATIVSLLVLAFIVIVVVNSFPLIHSNMSQKSPAIRIVMGYVFLAIPLGFSMMFIYISDSLIRLVKRAGLIKSFGRNAQ